MENRRSEFRFKGNPYHDRHISFLHLHGGGRLCVFLGAYEIMSTAERLAKIKNAVRVGVRIWGQGEVDFLLDQIDQRDAEIKKLREAVVKAECEFGCISFAFRLKDERYGMVRALQREMKAALQAVLEDQE